MNRQVMTPVCRGLAGPACDRTNERHQQGVAGQRQRRPRNVHYGIFRRARDLPKILQMLGNKLKLQAGCYERPALPGNADKI